MSDIANQQYLLGNQYQNAEKLNVRIQLHQRFSQNKYDWHRWIFDHLAFTPGAKVLELGCGPAHLWQRNLDRLPSDSSITLSDFSTGMLDEARQTLAKSSYPFTFQVIDAQAIPLPDQSLDMVIANHMLYHVPDRQKALAEIQRVLKPTGRFYAATNGHDNLKEIRELFHQVAGNYLWGEQGQLTFHLEMGEEELRQHFASVEVIRNEDQLVVTEAEPLIDYILSGSAGKDLTDEQKATLAEIIERQIATQGAVRIQKVAGLFVAHG